jgi:hypothetical protein
MKKNRQGGRVHIRAQNLLYFHKCQEQCYKCHQYKKYEEGKVNGRHVSEYEVLAVEVCNPCRVHTIR